MKRTLTALSITAALAPAGACGGTPSKRAACLHHAQQAAQEFIRTEQHSAGQGIEPSSRPAWQRGLQRSATTIYQAEAQRCPDH